MKETFCRIDGVIARGANKAVIFRRGPSDYTQMLLWDFNSDTVIPGQWLKAKIHTELCIVTDDAEFVAIQASGYSNVKKREEQHLNNWIAVSRPPYFSALGLWQSSLYLWTIGLPDQQNNLKRIQLPSTAIKLAMHVCRPSHSSQHEREGWVSENTSEQIQSFNNWRDRSKPGETLTYRKDFGQGYLIYQITQNRKKITMTNAVTIFDKESEEVLTIQSEPTHPLWIDLDNSGRLVYADKGCLWEWATFPEGKPKLIADLNPNTFEEVAPPDWALRP